MSRGRIAGLLICACVQPVRLLRFAAALLACAVTCGQSGVHHSCCSVVLSGLTASASCIFLALSTRQAAAGSCNLADWSLHVFPALHITCLSPLRIAMLGRCCSASCAPSSSACALVSLRPQQLRPCGGVQHRPATATVAAAAGRGGGGRGSSAGRSSSTTGRGRGMSAADGISAKELNSSISGCSTAESLMQLVDRHAASFNFIHASTALTRAAKLMRAPLSADEGECIAQLLHVAGHQLEQCGAWALANMAWALAKLDYKDTAFMRRLVQQSTRQLSSFGAQDIANTVWAMARYGYEDKAFMQQLLAHARSQNIKQDFNSQEMSNIFWAMAKLQHVTVDRQLVQGLLEHAEPQLPHFSQQALANTAWALATLRHYDQRFVELLLQQSMANVAGDIAQHISNTLWALAAFDHNNPAFVDKAVRRLLLLAPEFINDQDLANALWALSMLQHDAEAVAGPLFTAAEARFAADSALDLHLRQVHRYLTTMEGAGHFSKQLQASPRYLRLRHDCQAAFMREVNEDRSKIPRLAAAVIEELQKLPGCGDAQPVQLTEDQQVMMSIVVTLPCNTKAAVETVPQTACMANAPDKPLGLLLWRHKQLAARGYKVVVVKEADWLDVGPEMQQMYLRMRFREAGVVLPAASSVAGAA